MSPGLPDGGTESGANRVRIDLAEGVEFDSKASQRNFYTASSCGVCGKASIDAVRVRNISPPNPNCTVDPEVLCRLPDQLRAEQAVFSRTGALHAAGLFSLRRPAAGAARGRGPAQRGGQGHRLGAGP